MDLGLVAERERFDELAVEFQPSGCGSASSSIWANESSWKNV